MVPRERGQRAVSIGELAVEVLAGLAAVILLLAAAAKLRPDPPVAATIRALGLGNRILPAPRIAHLVGVAELLAFLGITLVRSRASAALLAGLGLAFAGAGGYARWRGLDVACGCFEFGPAPRSDRPEAPSRLGMRQMLALPVWLAAAAAPLAVPAYVGQEDVVRLLGAYAAVGVALSVVLWHLVPLWTQAVDRRLRAGGVG